MLKYNIPNYILHALQLNVWNKIIKKKIANTHDNVLTNNLSEKKKSEERNKAAAALAN